MGGGAWWAVVHGITKSQTRLSDFSFTFHFHALEQEMATDSSIRAWRIPGVGEPGGLPSVGSHRVGHDCCSSSSKRKQYSTAMKTGSPRDSCCLRVSAPPLPALGSVPGPAEAASPKILLEMQSPSPYPDLQDPNLYFNPDDL